MTDKMLSPHRGYFLIVVVGTVYWELRGLRAEHRRTLKWSINHWSSQAIKQPLVEKSGRTFRAVSHYLNGYGQMSCVTSWRKAYQNTSGHNNIITPAAPLRELIVSFILQWQLWLVRHHLSSAVCFEQGCCRLSLSIVLCLPGSSLASSAVLPSSTSKSMSRMVLWSWFRGTEERGEGCRFR